MELDWSIIGWDGDLYFSNDSWHYQNFKGSKWQKINQEIIQKYMINTYRVLLTRARQGMIIFIPEGDDNDETRKNEYYDGTYGYLKSLGISELI